ncbi:MULTISPECIES: type II secretion system protein GspK [unclassified Pseudomonas]|uniref:type II secretion system protein GspK n=1 Tax=unclassified Pseudomonas TaxID=196821 RepID=UPI001199D630|nr:MULTISPECIES: type II secretion system protein GspK [unclassified Pseudomonas]TWC10532.1 type II secretion system protein K (GspK) [Pseudomonas sp. SJZ075]TWC26687.1 type II secretion system protein K (GspK) [Pseudomonas sp. SJZ078]TWC45856.1 type II secretion system protein K (GspK) [Pseudomonas sp. SJZ124]TWC46121.1 type II secretion system protein K (GspK) [Pseudomonas sp. SJZ080]TWC81129.1 type II secretion system protein K (GspK) [Pseudomonas sp. SJZ101]
MNQQRGVALISVLLVLSLALLLTGGMLRSHRLLLQSSAQQLQQVQLRQLAMAGESWGRMILQSSAITASGPVSLSQDWARLGHALEVEDAEVHVDVEDLSGRLNLNALLGQGQIDQLTLGRWKRLLQLLNLPELSLPQVGLVQELSQLRLLPGIDGQTLQRLEPWVVLLPREAKLNVNTASELLLMTLDGMEAGPAKAVIDKRSSTPYASVQAFTGDPLLSGLGIGSHGLGVSSRWFRITVDVAWGNSRLRLASDIERNPATGRWTVHQRRFLPTIT